MAFPLVPVFGFRLTFKDFEERHRARRRSEGPDPNHKAGPTDMALSGNGLHGFNVAIFRRITLIK